MPVHSYIDSSIIEECESKAINKIFTSKNLYPKEIEVNVLGTDQSKSALS